MFTKNSFLVSATHYFIAVTGILMGSTCAAQDRGFANLCDQAARYAADNSDVPLEILLAVARVETGRTQNNQLLPWPWTVNLQGKGHWFDTADQAIDFADSQLAIGVENFDVGCFQINLRWHGAEFSTFGDVFDPQTNATYAAKFLTELYESEGSWKQAVAAFHSRTPELAAEYLQNIEEVYAQMQASGPDFGTAAVAAAARPNRFPLLQKGTTASAGSLVPLRNTVTPLIGWGQ